MKPSVHRALPHSGMSTSPAGKRWHSIARASCAAWVLAASLSGCGDISSTSSLAMADSPLQGSAATAEASAPLTVTTPSEGTASDAAQPAAVADPGTEGSELRDATSAKNTPPPRTERQAGEISDPSPSGFRLGGITVVVDGSTRIEPVTALAEGEPVDVTGHFESDRRTLRATVVRSTRPATDTATPGTAEASQGQSS